jgi:hypothetical protein
MYFKNQTGNAVIIDKLKVVLVAGIYVVLLEIPAVYAESSTQDEFEIVHWTYKLTPSYYVTTHETEAIDLNLRANYGPHATWLGYYRRGNEFDQIRTGYEYTAQFSIVQLVPSLQLASYGFAGGSVNAQIGGSIYALLGFGRTNLRDYYNLNFDPNDSITYGIGSRLNPKSTLTLFTVKDNRLQTGQIITHAVWRWAFNDHQRWTIDLSNKRGRASIYDEPVCGNGFSATYDYQNIFFRLAEDQKVNFTADNQTRLTIGLRF